MPKELKKQIEDLIDIAESLRYDIRYPVPYPNIISKLSTLMTHGCRRSFENPLLVFHPLAEIIYGEYYQFAHPSSEIHLLFFKVTRLFLELSIIPCITEVNTLLKKDIVKRYIKETIELVKQIVKEEPLRPLIKHELICIQQAYKILDEQESFFDLLKKLGTVLANIASGNFESAYDVICEAWEQRSSLWYPDVLRIVHLGKLILGMRDEAQANKGIELLGQVILSFQKKREVSDGSSSADRTFCDVKQNIHVLLTWVDVTGNIAKYGQHSGIRIAAFNLLCHACHITIGNSDSQLIFKKDKKSGIKFLCKLGEVFAELQYHSDEKEEIGYKAGDMFRTLCGCKEIKLVAACCDYLGGSSASSMIPQSWNKSECVFSTREARAFGQRWIKLYCECERLIKTAPALQIVSRLKLYSERGKADEKVCEELKTGLGLSIEQIDEMQREIDEDREVHGEERIRLMKEIKMLRTICELSSEITNVVLDYKTAKEDLAFEKIGKIVSKIDAALASRSSETSDESHFPKNSLLLMLYAVVYNTYGIMLRTRPDVEESTRAALEAFDRSIDILEKAKFSEFQDAKVAVQSNQGFARLARLSLPSFIAPAERHAELNSIEICVDQMEKTSRHDWAVINLRAWLEYQKGDLRKAYNLYRSFLEGNEGTLLFADVTLKINLCCILLDAEATGFLTGIKNKPLLVMRYLDSIRERISAAHATFMPYLRGISFYYQGNLADAKTALEEAKGRNFQKQKKAIQDLVDRFSLMEKRDLTYYPRPELETYGNPLLKDVADHTTESQELPIPVEIGVGTQLHMSDIEYLEKQLSSKLEEIEMVQATIEKLKEKLAICEANERRLTQELESAPKQLTEIKQTHEREIEVLQKDIKEIQARARELENQLNAANEELAKTRAEMGALRNQLRAAEDKVREDSVRSPSTNWATFFTGMTAGGIVAVGAVCVSCLKK